MTSTPTPGAMALVEAAARRIVRDTTTLPVPGWRLMPETPALPMPDDLR